jgi:hypothetical protein
MLIGMRSVRSLDKHCMVMCLQKWHESVRSYFTLIAMNCHEFNWGLACMTTTMAQNPHHAEPRRSGQHSWQAAHAQLRHCISP